VHANVVAVFDAGETDGKSFLAMELVEGTNLRARITDKGVSFTQRLKWLVDVARGLAAAHARGLVHRDVKPDNVLISESGVAKLTDFGIVRRTDRAPTSFRTATGDVFGTPEYMAPEQWQDAGVDARADQYAWGLVAYELFSRRSVPIGKPPPIQTVAPEVPDVVAACITRAIAHDREGRWPSMDAVIAELEPFVADALPFARTEPSNPDIPDSDRTGPKTPKNVILPPTPRAAAHSPRGRGARRRGGLRKKALTFVVAVLVTLLLGGIAFVIAHVSRPHAVPPDAARAEEAAPSPSPAPPPPVEDATVVADATAAVRDATAPASRARSPMVKGVRRVPVVDVALTERCAEGAAAKTSTVTRRPTPDQRSAVVACVMARMYSGEAFRIWGEMTFEETDGGTLDFYSAALKDMDLQSCLTAAVQKTVKLTIVDCPRRTIRLVVTPDCTCIEEGGTSRRLCFRAECAWAN
jgi:hypothetical protein